MNVVSRLGFDPSTLALKGYSSHNRKGQAFPHFFKNQAFEDADKRDSRYVCSFFCEHISTNLAQSPSRNPFNTLHLLFSSVFMMSLYSHVHFRRLRRRSEKSLLHFRAPLRGAGRCFCIFLILHLISLFAPTPRIRRSQVVPSSTVHFCLWKRLFSGTFFIFFKAEKTAVLVFSPVPQYGTEKAGHPSHPRWWDHGPTYGDIILKYVNISYKTVGTHLK